MFMPLRKSEALFSIDGDVERIQAADLATTPQYQGAYDFAGVDTHYFMSAAVKPGAAELAYYPLSIPSKTADAAVSRDYVGVRHPLPGGADRTGDHAILRRTEAFRNAEARPIPIWCAPSGSACSRFSACRCSRR